MLAVGLAAGRLARRSGLGSFVGALAVVPVVARTHGRPGAAAGAGVVATLLATLARLDAAGDVVTTELGDISLARGGDRCVECGGTLEESRAVELGNLFRLGDYYSRALDLSFQEEGGEQVFPHMGSYGIGIGRLLAAIVEANNDDDGIIWPRRVAPYQL